MKIKGISVIEQHVEKGVLGLAILALVAVGAWQFLGSPSNVTVDGRQVGPGEVDEILAQRADALSRQLADQAPVVGEPFPDQITLQADAFATGLGRGTGAADSLPRLAPSLAQALIPSDLGAAVWFAEPRFAAPSVIARVQQTDDALTEEIVRAVPELASRFGASSASRDISYLTPSATIEPAALREALRASDSAATPPRVAIPSLWYNDRLFILDLLCEREEQRPDGTFGNRVLVSPLPSQTTLRSNIADDPGASERNQILEFLGDDAIQRSILQPDFLPTRNSAFVPPSIEEESDGALDPAQRMHADVERFRAAAARTRERLDELGGPLEDDRTPGGRPDRPDGERGGRGPQGGGAAPGGGAAAPGGGLGGAAPGAPAAPGGGAAGGDGDAAASRATDRLRRGLTIELRRQEERVTRAEAELREIAPHLLDGSAGVARAPFSLTDDEPIQVWAHDIDVQPGMTYRYRFVLRMYNPFFARKRQLVEEQGNLAETIFIDSVASEWSEPVELSRPVEFFVSRATPGEGPLGLGTAQVEVFRLFEGRWRREVFTVTPGDRIGRVVEPTRGRDEESSVDFITEWFVVDIVDDPTGEARADRSRPALVVLQRIGSSERFVVRDPTADQSDSKRQRLYRDFSVG